MDPQTGRKGNAADTGGGVVTVATHLVRLEERSDFAEIDAQSYLASQHVRGVERKVVAETSDS